MAVYNPVMPLFTHALAVDWSANNKPNRGQNSIWVAEAGQQAVNIFTRHACLNYLKARILRALETDERLIIGLDFAFGYPAGISKIITGQADWQTLWSYIAAQITDTPKNESNRFEVGGHLNACIGLGDGPFWGHPWQHKNRYAQLDMYAPKDLPPSFQDKRIVETRMPKAQSTFKLSGIGSVGSQTLLGIAALHRLISNKEIGPHIAVWPFETHLSGNFSKPITLAEIYPSAHNVDYSLHKTPDAAQVMSVARDLSQWNRTGALEDKLSAFGLSDCQRALVIKEEGWILGV